MNADEMVEQGQKLAELGEGIIVKVPMTADGLKATRRLSELGIKTNVTLIFSSPQALLAARAGAKEISQIFKVHNFSSEIITVSVRTTTYVIEAVFWRIGKRRTTRASK